MSTMNQGMRRALLAMLVTPLTPSAVVILTALVVSPAEALWSSLFVLPLSYAAMLFPGIPLYLAVRWLSWNSVWAFVAIGAVCSFAASLFLMRGPITRVIDGDVGATLQPFLALASLATVFGSLSGIVFWKIARPDSANPSGNA